MANDDPTPTTDDKIPGDDPTPTSDDTPKGADDDKVKTALDDAGKGDDPAPAAAADFPEQWRDLASGGDEAVAKRLGRYKSYKDVAKALVEAQDKLRAGATPEKPGEDASEEEIAAYRDKLGVPEKPEGYLDKMEGVVVGDEDKELVDGFLSTAHESNVPPEFVNMAVSYIMDQQEKLVEKQRGEDNDMSTRVVEELREEWGPDYRANVTAAKNFIEATAGEMEGGKDFYGALMDARLGDGTLFGNNPVALRWLTGLAHEANPAGFTAPSEGSDQISSIKSELEQIRDVMKNDRKKYNDDPKMQERYRQLLAAEDKLSQAA